MEVVEDLATTIDCKQTQVRAVRFNSDGEYCLTCGSDKTIKLWNPYKGLLLKTYTGHGNEVLDAQGSCDNSQLCSGGLDKSVVLWDVASGKMERKFSGHQAKVDCVAFNEDSSVVLSGSMDGCVLLWDARSRKYEPVQILDDAKDGVCSVKVSDYEIFTASTDKHIRKYDIRQGRLTTDFLTAAVTSVSVSRDAQCILASTLDHTVRLLDAKDGALLNQYKGHRAESYKMDSVISSDDQQVISASEDGCIYVWHLIKSTLLRKLTHPGSIVRPCHSISYHPTKPLLLSASFTHVYLWEPKEKLMEIGEL